MLDHWTMRCFWSPESGSCRRQHIPSLVRRYRMPPYHLLKHSLNRLIMSFNFDEWKADFLCSLFWLFGWAPPGQRRSQHSFEMNTIYVNWQEKSNAVNMQKREPTIEVWMFVFVYTRKYDVYMYIYIYTPYIYNFDYVCVCHIWNIDKTPWSACLAKARPCLPWCS